MKKTLYFDYLGPVHRAALFEDGQMTELHTETDRKSEQTGSLFYGKVLAIKPALNAAFVDIGQELNAFLPLERGQTLRCGDFVIVQGENRQPTDTKGLRVTRKINLAGKWLVLTPTQNELRISKKIKEAALRNELEEIGARIKPENCGIIIRTASSDCTETALAEEAVYLTDEWNEISRRAAGMLRPGLLRASDSLDVRLLRELSNIDVIFTNDDESMNRLTSAKESGLLPDDTVIERWNEEKGLIFDACGAEGQIDKLLRPRVWLPSGGYLVINPCEALTVIDVNSGKMMLSADTEEMALAVNLEAVREAARQLRLRDIGGIIVIDLIDMKRPENREKVIAAMKKALERDRSKTKVEGITKLGLLEMTRKRQSTELRKVLRIPCSYCGGDGEVLGGEEIAGRVLRQLRRMQLAGQAGPFLVKCAPSCADVLSHCDAPDNADIYVIGQRGHHLETFQIEQPGRAATLPDGAKALPKRSIK